MLESNKTTYGIIGNPVEHSLSPLMHNAAFAELGVDATYELFPLEESELKGFFGDLRKDSSPIFGLNVTVPYKEAVIEYLDSLAPFAQKAGAVNTIVITDKRKLVGYNTDGPGFLAHLVELDYNLQDKNITILGAGGSTRAILASLCIIPDQPLSIKVYNRTTSRMDDLLQDLKERIDVSRVESVMSIDDLDIRSADLLINTTSVGMNEDDPVLIEEDLLHPGMLVYDIIYNPAETQLLKMAKNQGAMAANGLGMLFYQGVLALEHWAETRLEDHIKVVMRKSLEEAIQS